MENTKMPSERLREMEPALQARYEKKGEMLKVARAAFAAPASEEALRDYRWLLSDQSDCLLAHLQVVDASVRASSTWIAGTQKYILSGVEVVMPYLSVSLWLSFNGQVLSEYIRVDPEDTVESFVAKRDAATLKLLEKYIIAITPERTHKAMRDVLRAANRDTGE